MKVYTKPEIEVTVFESEKILLVSGGTQSSTNMTKVDIKTKDLPF